MEILKLGILCLTLLLILNLIVMWMIADGVKDLSIYDRKLQILKNDLIDRTEALHSFLRNQQTKVLNQMSPQKEKLQMLNKQIATIHKNLKTTTLNAKILKFTRKETK